VGRQIDVRGPVVAINTVHATLRHARHLFGRELIAFRRAIFGDVALPVFDANPRDHLALLVYRDVSDLVGDVHVPVYACGDAGRGRRAATDIEEHARLSETVLFVVAVVAESFQLCAPKLVGLVALRARLIRRAQVMHRRFDRAWVSVEGDRIELICARQFRAHVPLCAAADVTFDATHARVWTRLIGDKLRLHHRVASLPAEGDRLAVLESAIATEGAHKEEDESKTGERQE